MKKRKCRETMTIRKTDNVLRGDRTRSRRTIGLSRHLGQLGPRGILPPSCAAFPNGSPRWRWEDVDRKLSRDGQETSDEKLMMRGAINFGSKTSNHGKKTTRAGEQGVRLGIQYRQKRTKGSIGLRSPDEGAEDEGGGHSKDDVLRPTLSVKQVLAIILFSRTTLWKVTKQGRFPTPREIMPGRIALFEDEVKAWQKALDEAV